jgi:outer membrane protein OmpA-like peptidoglycan-associated protein
VYAEGFFMESTMLRALPGKMKPVELKLRPAIPGEKVDIPNLYFVGNKAELLPKSEPELPKILRFMKVNPGLKIQIAGHVNFPNRPPVSKNTPEYRLSVARAKLVYDYLISNGISADRLEYQGYGNWEMVYPNAVNESEQAKNRRVEIRVVK